VSGPRRVLWSCALAAAFVVAHASSAQPSAAGTPPTGGSVRVKTAERSSPGKPQPPISARYRLSAPPAIGVPLVVTVTAHAAASQCDLSIEVRAADGASVPSPARRVAAATPGECAWEIVVAPLSSPAGRLNVLVRGEGAAGPQARSLSVPLRTGANAQSAVRVAPNGERLIALPAEESPAEELR
jgi:hypothetical protein